ncbi:hypothetical protein GCM10007079_26030 [Nocardiopsis terrae]|uniref:SnoaL-like domain-containing protein n=1 Tax=Nocardiopsis terrae TaxID=372655 RepID=A0ABR9HFH9_9ACTN|nr:hypothetical protein [Nocardiopsis terrae]MBE1457794.1 hypothetical protein [Nocardiopsis terrae]GHC84234.1 hypothetical protein GCM10007079_26030 [Nocardiopsis terrae]
MEHVLLSYLYLDERDLDGYASLLDSESGFCATDPDRARAPEAAAAFVFEQCVEHGRSHPERVISSGADVIVTGTLTPHSPDASRSRAEFFADFFTISEHGLLCTWRRFYAFDESTRETSGSDREG